MDRTQLRSFLAVLLVGAACFVAQTSSAGQDANGNETVQPPQIGFPGAGHVQVQTTPTPIVVPSGPSGGASNLSLYNYGTSQVCCTWTYPDGGGYFADGGGAPTLGGPTPCMLEVQATANGLPIPGAAQFNVVNKTVSCVAAVAQSTDGGDLRFFWE